MIRFVKKLYYIITAPIRQHRIKKCSLIATAVEWGIGKPDTDKSFCMGYAGGNDTEDDEPCDICKNCKNGYWDDEGERL